MVRGRCLDRFAFSVPLDLQSYIHIFLVLISFFDPELDMNQASTQQKPPTVDFFDNIGRGILSLGLERY
jgi:hypothetical protein